MWIFIFVATNWRVGIVTYFINCHISNFCLILLTLQIDIIIVTYISTRSYRNFKITLYVKYYDRRGYKTVVLVNVLFSNVKIVNLNLLPWIWPVRITLLVWINIPVFGNRIKLNFDLRPTLIAFYAFYLFWNELIGFK